MEDITVSFMTKPVPEWGRTLDEAEFPHIYFGTFGAIVANVFCLALGSILCGPFISINAEIFVPDKNSKEWLVH